KIAAGTISPRDVKNVEGKMEHTTLPRVPGRDYASTVIHGPVEWIGAEVWGNTAYQWLRNRRGRSADVSLDTVLPVFDQHGRHPEPIADWSTSIDDPARQTELRMLLSAAIEELPAGYRMVFVLRDVEGLSYQEVAEALGLRVGNVETRL